MSKHKTEFSKNRQLYGPSSFWLGKVKNRTPLRLELSLLDMCIWGSLKLFLFYNKIKTRKCIEENKQKLTDNTKLQLLGWQFRLN